MHETFNMQGGARGYARVHWPDNITDGRWSRRGDWSFNESQAHIEKARNPVKVRRYGTVGRYPAFAEFAHLLVGRTGAQSQGGQSKPNQKGNSRITMNTKATKGSKQIKTRKVVKLSKKARRSAALKAWETIRANRKAAEKTAKQGKNGTKPTRLGAPAKQGSQIKGTIGLAKAA